MSRLCCLGSLGSQRRGIGTSGACYSLFRYTQGLACKGASLSLLSTEEARIPARLWAGLMNSHAKRQLAELFCSHVESWFIISGKKKNNIKSKPFVKWSADNCFILTLQQAWWKKCSLDKWSVLNLDSGSSEKICVMLLKLNVFYRTLPRSW